MASVIEHDELPRHGRPAPVARSFGWLMLTVLAAFLINNVLVVWFGFPGLRGIGGFDGFGRRRGRPGFGRCRRFGSGRFRRGRGSRSAAAR